MKLLNQFFHNFFLIYRKMSQLYQLCTIKKIKKRLQKKLTKDIKILLKKKNKKSSNMVVKAIKISWKMTNKSLLSTEKNIIK